MPDARKLIALRIAPDGLRRLDAVAREGFGGNRSAALRTLLRLGLAAWNHGAR